MPLEGVFEWLEGLEPKSVRAVCVSCVLGLLRPSGIVLVSAVAPPAVASQAASPAVVGDPVAVGSSGEEGAGSGVAAAAAAAAAAALVAAAAGAAVDPV